MDEQPDDLLAGLRCGDPAAFTEFVRRTQAEVWRFVAHLADPQAADDLTQETYVRALRTVSSYRGEASLRTWLFVIARRVVADELRSRTRRRRLDAALQDLHAPAVPDPALDAELRAVIHSLPAERREAFVLTQLVGLSYAEAAGVAGVPIGTIRSRVARARGDLLTLLADEVREAG